MNIYLVSRNYNSQNDGAVVAASSPEEAIQLLKAEHKSDWLFGLYGVWDIALISPDKSFVILESSFEAANK